MRLRIQNFHGNVSGVLRTCGYAFDRNEDGESSYVRRLAGEDYPRLHAYVRLINNDDLIVNLHLDQKRPSYSGGTRAHSGEYDGLIITEELQRIERIITRESGAMPKKLEPW